MLVIKNGQILQQIYNDNLKIQELKPLENSLNHYYNESLIFSEDLNLEGFFDALYPHFKQLDVDFIAYTNGFTLKEYYEDLKKEINPEENNKEISHIEFYHCYCIHSHLDLMSGKTEITVDDYTSYHGKNVNPEECNYSLSLSGLNSLKHLKLTLEKSYDIHMYDFEATEKHKILVKDVIKDWNLHEILASFLNELTFHGHPQDIKNFSESLEISSEELKTALDNDEEVSIPIESLLITWLEEDLKKAEEQQNFEACERIKNKIQQHRDDLKDYEEKDKEEKS